MSGKTASDIIADLADGPMLADLEALIDLQRRQLDAIKRLSDVGELFDGADHLNEYTHEANANHMEAALDRIYAIATGKEPPEA